MADLADLLKEHATLVVDALRRESQRFQKVATAAAGDPTNDPARIVQILGDASRLVDVANALTSWRDLTSSDTMPAPAAPEEEVRVEKPPNTQVENVLSKQAKTPPAVDLDEEDEDAPIHATVLAPDAIAMLLNDGDDPLPEDAQSPSAQQSVAHGDEFGDAWPSTAE